MSLFGDLVIQHMLAEHPRPQLRCSRDVDMQDVTSPDLNQVIIEHVEPRLVAIIPYLEEVEGRGCRV